MVWAILSNMVFTEIYRPKQTPMRVAGFMSGSGTNLVKIIEHGRKIEAEERRGIYRVVVIFSDNRNSGIKEIATRFGIDYVVNDIGEFYRDRRVDLNNISVRALYDSETVRLLKPFGVDVVACAGYMRRITAPLLEAYPCVNVHPADLSITINGRRRYVGANAVKDAILAGECTLRSSTHLMTKEVDGGPVLMVSSPLLVILPEDFDASNNDMVERVAQAHQQRLKEAGDWVIFPLTLEYIAKGKYARDAQGNLYFEDMPIPQGVKL